MSEKKELKQEELKNVIGGEDLKGYKYEIPAGMTLEDFLNSQNGKPVINGQVEPQTEDTE